jgi:hypothetical protein
MQVSQLTLKIVHLGGQEAQSQSSRVRRPTGRLSEGAGRNGDGKERKRACTSGLVMICPGTGVGGSCRTKAINSPP